MAPSSEVYGADGGPTLVLGDDFKSGVSPAVLMDSHEAIPKKEDAILYASSHHNPNHDGFVEYLESFPSQHCQGVLAASLTCAPTC